MQRPIQSIAVGFCLVCLALFASPTHAQEKKEKKYKEIEFPTVDHVTLSGRFWPSKLGKEAPVAMLLHKIGGKSTEDGWMELADELHKADIAVLSFDFRGHGDSKSLDDRMIFSRFPVNRSIRQKNDDKEKKTYIDQVDFPASYYPHLVNDIAAAKRFLDRRHDSGECNTSALILIGAEDGATLGTLWLATEMKRYLQPVIPINQIGPINITQKKPESKEIIACIWLNIASNLGKQSVNVASLKSWLRDTGNNKESKVPMAFAYGNEDKLGSTNALAYIKAIRPKYDPLSKVKLNDGLDGLTGRLEVGGTKLTGAKLLTIASARTSIKDFLSKSILSQKDVMKKLNTWEKLDSEYSVSGWYMTGLNPSLHSHQLVLGKLEQVNLIPIHLPPFGFR